MTLKHWRTETNTRAATHLKKISENDTNKRFKNDKSTALLRLNKTVYTDFETE